MHPSASTSLLALSVTLEEPKRSAIVGYLNKLWNIGMIEQDAAEQNN